MLVMEIINRFIVRQIGSVEKDSVACIDVAGYLQGKKYHFCHWYYYDDIEGNYIEEYLDDKMHGVHIGWENNKLAFRHEYSHGRQHGRSMIYYTSGLLKSDETYQHGKRCGICWYYDGDLTNIKHYS